MIACRIADGALRVELTRTLNTDVPGMLFGVMANVYSNEDDTPVDGTCVCQTSDVKWSDAR
jgi:hypothetical protein